MKKLILLCASALMISSCNLVGSQSPAPATHFGTKEGPGATGVHTVLPGDTLWSISQRYNIALQDIAVTNNLQAPFNLEDGQRLRLPPPQEYRVRLHDSLYTISRIFGVSTTSIAQQNNLSAPYELHVGQVLKLPSVTRKTSSAVGGAIARAAPQSTTADIVTPGQKPTYSQP